MTGVAALYDIHGNAPALDAVLAELELLRPELILVGGDIAAGPMPAETLSLLRSLDGRVQFIRGNADRRLDGGAGAGGAVSPRRRWVEDRLDDEGRDFLDRLPEHAVLDVTGLGSVLFCHASPRSDEEIVTDATSDERLRTILSGVTEQVVVCGHTHMQFDRSVDGIRVVNAGSVGLPYEQDPGAYWALLGSEVELRRTAYDFERAGHAIAATGFPQARQYARALYADPPQRVVVTEVFEELAGRPARGAGES